MHRSVVSAVRIRIVNSMRSLRPVLHVVQQHAASDHGAHKTHRIAVVDQFYLHAGCCHEIGYRRGGNAADPGERVDLSPHACGSDKLRAASWRRLIISYCSGRKSE
jgi:hypothetical protein